MTFHDVTNKLGKMVVDNSPLILTAVGVTGTITTAVLTHKAAIKAHSILAVEESLHPEMDRKEKLKLVWTVYIPPVSTGVMTVGAIVLANRIGTRRAAALAAAYSISERAFTEYKEKALEVVGKNKELAIRDQVVQDRLNNNPTGKNEIVILGDSEVLCYDMYTDRYFKSNMESIKQAMNNLNHRVINHGYASLTDFYEMLGLGRTMVSDDMGWSSDELMDIQFTSGMSDDMRPCLAINFKTMPFRNYYRANPSR